MSGYYDELETRPRPLREAAQFSLLSAQIAHAKAHSPYWREHLKDIEAEAVRDRSALAALPLTRKSDLSALQQKSPPFGGLATVAPGAMRRIFQSPGPIYDVEGGAADYWRLARALFAAGIRAGDLVHVAFAYHLTPAGMMADSGARTLGCAVFPGGTGNTEQQVRAIADLRPNAYVGTPSFLTILLDRAAESGVDVSSLRVASVAAEALPATLRQSFATRGVHVRQWYGTADVGLIAYESEALPGLIVDEGVIVEVVRPGTGDVVADGEVGEVVVSLLQAREYPLIRFATGDLSAVMTGESACGRTNIRLAGWLGRADQAAKVRGLFVHPSQVAEIVRRHPEIGKARLVITTDHGVDALTLTCEGSPAAASSDALRAAVAETLQAVTRLRGQVAWVAAGTLPNDGKVIEDRRNLV